MTMLANEKETRAMTLADYEARIHLYKEQGAMAYIGIGRTLTEAKEAGVVPHGQWETWVQEVAGFTPRQAQRCMQVAEKVPEGSAMARLDISKALLLISSGLDEEEQEAIAEKAAEENPTVKELKEQLRKAKLQVVQETGAAAEIREELKRIRSERESLENQLKATIEGYQKRMDMDEEKYRQQMDEECGKAYRQGAESAAEVSAREMAERDARIREMQAEIDKEKKRAQQLRERLANVKDELWDEVQNEFETKLDKVNAQNATLNDRLKAARSEAEEEVREELDALRRDRQDMLAAAEEAEKRAADAEAELEVLKAGRDPGKTPVAITLARAVNAFMAECELMPWYPAELQAEAGPIRSSLEQLDDWCTRMHGALVAAVPGEGAVE